MMREHGWYGGYGGMNIWMILFIVLIIGLIIAFGIILFKYMNAKNEQTDASQSALDILKTRLAKGEIGIEEYDRLKNKLED